MASKPYLDTNKRRWLMKWWAGPQAGWIKQPLGPHSGKTTRVPDAIELVARKYRDLETKARHGVDVAPARAHDLASYFGEYRKTFDASHPNNSGVNLRHAADSFLAFAQGTGAKTVESVSPKVCRNWMEAQLGKLAFSTIRMYKGYLSPIWSRAVVDGIIRDNPWRGLPVPGRAKDREPVYWTRDELAKLIGACDPWLRDLVLVGVNTGLRISAMLGLEWRDISFERNSLTVRQELSKSNRRYQVPLSATANEVLARRLVARSETTDLVFPGVRSGKLVRRTDTYDFLKTAASLAGIPDKGHHNHILRHTFASHAVMAGVPLLIVSAWLGHSTTRMVEIYAHLIPSESDRRMEQFDLRPPESPPPSG